MKFLGRIVGDNAVHDLAIGHHDLFIVARSENRRQNLHLNDNARDTGSLNEIANPVRAEHDNQYAGCEVGQSAL